MLEQRIRGFGLFKRWHDKCSEMDRLLHSSSGLSGEALRGVAIEKLVATAINLNISIKGYEEEIKKELSKADISYFSNYAKAIYGFLFLTEGHFIYTYASKKKGENRAKEKHKEHVKFIIKRPQYALEIAYELYIIEHNLMSGIISENPEASELMQTIEVSIFGPEHAQYAESCAKLLERLEYEQIFEKKNINTVFEYQEHAENIFGLISSCRIEAIFARKREGNLGAFDKMVGDPLIGFSERGQEIFRKSSQDKFDSIIRLMKELQDQRTATYNLVLNVWTKAPLEILNIIVYLFLPVEKVSERRFIEFLESKPLNLTGAKKPDVPAPSPRML